MAVTCFTCERINPFLRADFERDRRALRADAEGAADFEFAQRERFNLREERSWPQDVDGARWRAHAGHRAAQREGRASIFAGYRLGVAQVLRDYGPQDRAQAPKPAEP